MGPGVGVDHVVGPFFGWNSANCLIDPVLEPDADSVEFYCKSVGHCDVVLQIVKHRVTGVIAEHEGVHNYDLAVALGFCIFEHIAAIVLVFVDGYAFFLHVRCIVTVPGVVNTDHYAENIGAVLQAVAVPSPFQCACCIAAYAGIDYVQIEVRIAGYEEICGEKYIACSEGIGACFSSACIGDAVTGE